jgi:hypothetical protein
VKRQWSDFLSRIQYGFATHGLSGLVLQDVVNLGHDLGSQLGQDLESLAVVGNLLGFGGSEDTGGNVFVLSMRCRRQRDGQFSARSRHSP